MGIPGKLYQDDIHLNNSLLNKPFSIFAFQQFVKLLPKQGLREYPPPWLTESNPLAGLEKQM